MPANPPGHTITPLTYYYMEKKEMENTDHPIDSFALPSLMKEFELHPEGRFTGVVQAIEATNPHTETPDTPRIKITIETDNCPMSDGRNFAAWYTCNLSAHEKSNLYQFRVSILGRKLQGTELEKFERSELVGMTISYRIIHVPSTTDPKKIWANIRAGSVEHMDPNFVAPLPGATAHPLVAEGKAQGQASTPPPPPPPVAPVPQPATDDLPF